MEKSERGLPLEEGGRPWKATRRDFLESQRCSVSSLGEREHSYVTIVRTHQLMHRRPVCLITGKLYLNEINFLKRKHKIHTQNRYRTTILFT